jgi:hypothetical protein
MWLPGVDADNPSAKALVSTRKKGTNLGRYISLVGHGIILCEPRPVCSILFDIPCHLWCTVFSSACYDRPSVGSLLSGESIYQCTFGYFCKT